MKFLVVFKDGETQVTVEADDATTIGDNVVFVREGMSDIYYNKSEIDFIVAGKEEE